MQAIEQENRRHPAGGHRASPCADIRDRRAAVRLRGCPQLRATVAGIQSRSAITGASRFLTPVPPLADTDAGLQWSHKGLAGPGLNPHHCGCPRSLHLGPGIIGCSAFSSRDASHRRNVPQSTAVKEPEEAASTALAISAICGSRIGQLIVERDTIAILRFVRFCS